MANPLNISLRRNEDWGRLFQVRDGAGTPYPLFGWTAEMQVKSRLDNATVVASGICSVVLPALGWFSVILRASEGTPLAAYGDPLQDANLPFDIRLTSPAGYKLDFVAGCVILSRGVTLS